MDVLKCISKDTDIYARVAVFRTHLRSSDFQFDECLPVTSG